MVLKFKIVASGSDGNFSFLSTPEGTLLIDVGISRKRILDSLRKNNIPLSSISGILISHPHDDHCSGLPVLSSHIQVPIYCTKGTSKGMKNKFKSDHRWNSIKKQIQSIKNNQQIGVGEFTIHFLPTVHDTKDSSAFKIDYQELAISIITDTGKILSQHIQALNASNILLIEANHDIHELDDSDRPNYLKKRIKENHLSNDQLLEGLKQIYNDDIRVILFGHISDECNSPNILRNYFFKGFKENQLPWKWRICSNQRFNDLIDFSSNSILVSYGD